MNAREWRSPIETTHVRFIFGRLLRRAEGGEAEVKVGEPLFLLIAQERCGMTLINGVQSSTLRLHWVWLPCAVRQILAQCWASIGSVLSSFFKACWQNLCIQGTIRV